MSARRLTEGDLELLSVRPGICYGALEDLFLLYYQQSPTVEDLKTREPLLDRVAKAHPEGIAFLSIIDTSQGEALPGPEARAETARQAEAKRDVFRAGAMVLKGDGLKISLVRTLLRGLLFFRRGAVELRFFSSDEEAASWCLSKLGVPKEAREGRVILLMAAVERMKQEVERPAAGD